MKLFLVFVFLPLCLGQVTPDNCMTLVNDFTAIINGSTLDVCSTYLPREQCCSQANEDALGMTLNTALNSADLGNELRAMQGNVMALYSALTDLRLSLINDVLGPLMNTSADLTISNADEFTGDLNRIREEILYNINSTIAGNSDFNLIAEFTRFFNEGLSAFYYNVSFESSSAPAISNPDETQRNCSINAIYTHFYSMMDEAEIAALGGRLQQIATAFDVARAALPSLETVLAALENFTATSTCTNVWTLQYACPLCAGQAAPLCLGRCNEVLIGCMSSLRQVIVQLNLLLEFARGSVSSLISGAPYNALDVSSIADDYREIFTTIVTRQRDYIVLTVPGMCNLDRRKRSVDSPIVRHKRQGSTINITLANVTIDQSIVTLITDTLLPSVMNVSLSSDRVDLCNLLNSSGRVNCTNGVGNFGNSTLSTVGLEISDQVDNTAGTFNLTQLRYQAGSFPYVMTNLLKNRSDIMMLYQYVLPGRPVPNLDFLDEPTPVTTSAVPSATVTLPTPSPTPTGGAATISYSLFITLAALLLASVL